MNGRRRQISTANTRRLRSTIQRVEQQPYDLTSGRRPPRLSGSQGHAWCRLGGSLAAATGTWPSLTPASTTVTAYRSSGGSLTSLGTVTIYNWRNVAWAASKTTYLVGNPDGSYDVVDQDC